MSEKRRVLSLAGPTAEQKALINRKEPLKTSRRASPGLDAEPAESKPAVELAKPEPDVETTTQEPSTATVKKPRKPRAKSAVVEEQVPVLTTQTFRIPSTVAERLLRVSMERKLKKQRPYTQQDIVSEALEDWLEKEAG